MVVWAGAACGTEVPDSPGAAKNSAPGSSATVAVDAADKKKPLEASHAFWDRENLFLFSGIAMMRTLDYTSTRNMQRRGREEILLPDDVVNSRPGFVALEVAGAATSIGISYILHRTRHHTLERWLSLGHIGVTGFGAARNYALATYHVRK
jgi:hypothetical protein